MLLRRSSSLNPSKCLANIVSVAHIMTTVESLAALPKPSWNTALSNAGKIADYPTSSFGLRWLFQDEVANVGQHLHKIKDCHHPVIQMA